MNPDASRSINVTTSLTADENLTFDGSSAGHGIENSGGASLIEEDGRRGEGDSDSIHSSIDCEEHVRQNEQVQTGIISNFAQEEETFFSTKPLVELPGLPLMRIFHGYETMDRVQYEPQLEDIEGLTNISMMSREQPWQRVEVLHSIPYQGPMEQPIAPLQGLVEQPRVTVQGFTQQSEVSQLEFHQPWCLQQGNLLAQQDQVYAPVPYVSQQFQNAVQGQTYFSLNSLSTQQIYQQCTQVHPRFATPPGLSHGAYQMFRPYSNDFQAVVFTPVPTMETCAQPGQQVLGHGHLQGEAASVSSASYDYDLSVWQHHRQEYIRVQSSVKKQKSVGKKHRRHADDTQLNLRPPQTNRQPRGRTMDVNCSAGESSKPWEAGPLDSVRATLAEIVLSTDSNDKVDGSPVTPTPRAIRSEGETLEEVAIRTPAKSYAGVLKLRNCCVFCKSNKERWEYYSNHNLRDEHGHVTCPVLMKLVCSLCGATGHKAHTVKYCPFYASPEKAEGSKRPSSDAEDADQERRNGGGSGGMDKRPNIITRNAAGGYTYRRF